MASLADLKKSLNIIDLQTNKAPETVLGKKRRPWVYEEDNEEDVSNNESSSLATQEQIGERLVSNSLYTKNNSEQHNSNSLENALANFTSHVSS